MKLIDSLTIIITSLIFVLFFGLIINFCYNLYKSNAIQTELQEMQALIQKNDSENLRWKNLSPEEKQAEELQEIKESPWGTMEGHYNVTIFGPHRTNPQTYTNCSTIKAVGNYCSFNQNIEGEVVSKEFTMCEYEIPMGGVTTKCSPTIMTEKEMDEAMQYIKDHPTPVSCGNAQ